MQFIRETAIYSTMASQDLQDAPKTKKKRFFFSSKKKDAGKNLKSTESPEKEKPDRKEERRGSEKNLIALAYEEKAKRGSFIEESKRVALEQKEASDKKLSASKASSMLTGSSFFRKICDDVFDSIDADKSGKINESELYQGLLLIHLKLGMYFGPAACKPISLERTNYIFEKLDTNKDGSLDKEEFRSVLALLMGNVVSRITFQFLCTLLVVPFLASTIFEKSLDAFEIFREKYQPLIVVALGLDLISKYVNETAQRMEIAEIVSVPADFVAEKFDALVLQPIAAIPEETLEDLPVMVLSSIIAMIIVPYSIVKTDDFFRYMATKSD